MDDVTRKLARFIVESHWRDVPKNVRHEAKRSILNWLGTALGGTSVRATALQAFDTLPTESNLLFTGYVDLRAADRKRLVQVLNNLLENAIRHTGPGTSIDVVVEPDGTLGVTDDGPGIPEEQRADVFKPFVRLDEARNIDEGGSGLGLAIARDIARAHGGDVMLVDGPLGGLRATIRVPV